MSDLQDLSADEVERLFQSCERFLCWRPRSSPADVFRELADAVDENELADTYGRGEIVEGWEREVAVSLGKDDALVFATGVMAQLVALRIWCDRTGSNVVAYHPHAHFEDREEGALDGLHQINRVHVGSRERLITVDDIEKAPPRIAAFVLELPQRDLGGALPLWSDLQAQAEMVRQRNAALHLDGARIFEAQAFYGRPLSEICAPFSSIYLSFYKGLGAFAGAALVGDSGFIAEARRWRRRHGGECFQLYPFAVAARLAWSQRVHQFGVWREHAIAIGEALAHAGLRLTPSPPQTNLMHVFLDASPQAALAAAVELAQEQSICLFRRVRATGVPGICAFELPVHEGASAFSALEVADLVAGLQARAQMIDAEVQLEP